MSKWLVLGLGNPLSGADAFGPAVVDRLRRDADLTPGVSFIDADTDLLAHIHRFAEYGGVVLVDTVLVADAPHVAVIDEETFSTWNDRSLGAHELSAIACVKLFRRLDAGRHQVSISLVAQCVREADFRRPTAPDDVAAGAAAVREIITAESAPVR